MSFLAMIFGVYNDSETPLMVKPDGDHCPLCLIPRRNGSIDDIINKRCAWWHGHGPCPECCRVLHRLDGNSKRSS